MARRETSGWAFRVLNAPKTDLQLPNETLLRLPLHLVEEVRVNEGGTIALRRSLNRHAYAVEIVLCMRQGREEGQRQSDVDNT